MKPEMIATTSVSATAAAGFHLSPALDWQSELVRQRGREVVLRMPMRTFPMEILRKDPSGDEAVPMAAPRADWSCAEARLQELYPNPVGGVCLAELVSEGRGDR